MNIPFPKISDLPMVSIIKDDDDFIGDYNIVKQRQASPTAIMYQSELIIRRNKDGTPHIVKNRYGVCGDMTGDVAAEQLLKLAVHYMIQESTKDKCLPIITDLLIAEVQDTCNDILKKYKLKGS